VAAPGLGPLVGSDPAPIGCIGRLEAPGAAIAKTLLEQACAELGQRGCRLVLTPMDGDTWQPYRVLESDQDPGQAFAGEPDLALHWGCWLADAGFRVQARFVSTLGTNLQIRRPSPRLAVAIRLEQAQAVPMDDLSESIHHLVLEGFSANPCFAPPASAALAASGSPGAL